MNDGNVRERERDGRAKAISNSYLSLSVCTRKKVNDGVRKGESKILSCIYMWPKTPFFLAKEEKWPCIIRRKTKTEKGLS